MKYDLREEQTPPVRHGRSQEQRRHPAARSDVRRGSDTGRAMRGAAEGVAAMGLLGVLVVTGASAACASKPPPAAPEPGLVITPLPPSATSGSARPPARRPPPEPPPSSPPEGPDPNNPPAPLAPPCKTDAECVTHRCNEAFGRCAYPCTSDADCVLGASCFRGGAIAVCIRSRRDPPRAP